MEISLKDLSAYKIGILNKESKLFRSNYQLFLGNIHRPIFLKAQPAADEKILRIFRA